MQDFITFLQLHWVLSATFVVVIFALLIIEFIKQKQSATQLSPSQLTQMMNHEDAVVVDLRSSILFADGHIIGAQSIPFTELNQKIKKLDKFKSKPIVLVCLTGAEAPRAAITLKDSGFNIHTLAGGMRAWREADLPVVKG
ncbi:MAG: rhodanese-like domain-containing protein [Gammaproteobacteria bacterium]|nr:rhodanese-like domain-containing protein [Gammaproteobacteria bacterium]